MTRKDYIILVDALAAAKPSDLDGRARMFAWQRCVESIARALAADNGRFDPERFARAAGYPA